MQTKMTFRFHFNLVRTAKIKTTNDGKEVESRQPSCTADGSENWYNTVEIRFLKNTEIDLPYNPTIPLLGIYPKAFISYGDTSSPHVLSTFVIPMIIKCLHTTDGRQHRNLQVIKVRKSLLETV